MRNDTYNSGLYGANLATTIWAAATANLLALGIYNGMVGLPFDIGISRKKRDALGFSDKKKLVKVS